MNNPTDLAADRVIENLLYTYAERIDAGDLVGVGELFANGRLVPSADASPEGDIAGAEAVAGMYQGVVKIYPDGTPRTRHITANPIIDVDESTQTATARTTYTVMQQTDDLPLQAIISGRYEDTFHVVDGHWCFESRTMFVDLVGDLSHHLTMTL